MKSRDSGFTLVEVIVAMLLLVLLIISATFTFNMIARINSESSKQHQAVLLATSVLEKLRLYSFDDIDSFPEFELKSKDTNTKVLKLDSVLYGSYRYNVELSISRDGYSSSDSPELKNLGGNGVAIINPRLESYDFDLGFSDGGYYTYDDRYYYDNLMLEEFKLRNLDNYSLCDDAVLVDDLDLYNLVNREMRISVNDLGSSHEVEVTMYYELDESMSYDILGTHSNLYIVEVFKRKFDKLNSLYIIYPNTDCVGDKVVITNNDDLQFDLYFVVEQGYSKDGVSLQTVQVPSNLEFKYEQTSNITDLVNLYTNCYNLDSGTYISNKSSLLYSEVENGYKLYSARVRVYDLSEEVLYVDTVTSILR